MSHNNTVFSQILKFIPRHEFETLADRHPSGSTQGGAHGESSQDCAGEIGKPPRP